MGFHIEDPGRMSEINAKMANQNFKISIFSISLPALPLSRVPLLGNRGAFAPAGVSSAGGPTYSTHGSNVTTREVDSSAPAPSFTPWVSLDGGGKRLGFALNLSNLH